jgi:hypothetical protein
MVLLFSKVFDILPLKANLLNLLPESEIGQQVMNQQNRLFTNEELFILLLCAFSEKEKRPCSIAYQAKQQGWRYAIKFAF